MSQRNPPLKNPEPGVTAVTALEAKRADHTQSERGISWNRPTGPKSLWLKILPTKLLSPIDYFEIFR
jgi:hypothetical protein